MDNIVPFRPPTPHDEPPAFAPGVTPFDRANAAHVRAWNTIFALGWSELRAQERERERRRQFESAEPIA